MTILRDLADLLSAMVGLLQLQVYLLLALVALQLVQLLVAWWRGRK